MSFRKTILQVLHGCRQLVLRRVSGVKNPITSATVGCQQNRCHRDSLKTAGIAQPQGSGMIQYLAELCVLRRKLRYHCAGGQGESAWACGHWFRIRS
jgi:hypothetical protein